MPPPRSQGAVGKEIGEPGEYSRNEVGSARKKNKQHLRGKQMGSGSGAERMNRDCISSEAGRASPQCFLELVRSFRALSQVMSGH